MESIETKQQKKILRTLTRLKHSLAADREIYDLMKQYDQVGATGVVPKLQATLDDLTKDD